MKQISIVLVGIGGYGETYVRDIFESSNPMINLVGAVEPYPEKCRYYEELKKKGVPVYSTISDFFKEHSAHLTVISTPIFLHTEHIIEALKYNSNVLCEKPLCADEKDVELIRNAQKKSGKFVYIGYQWSYSDAITKLKEDINNKKFGELIEMKTLVLRPRTRGYFGRGVGWAGKIKTSDGRLVFDSIANNSAAHYLFNMIYIMTNENVRFKPENITAELLRANNIENFDACKINFTIKGAKASFIAAHPVEKTIKPTFEYKFTNGTIYYSNDIISAEYNFLPREYTEYGNIVAIMNDGSKIVYGNPMADSCKKLHIAVEDAANGLCKEGICGVGVTSIHTKLINKIQNSFNIHSVKKSYLKEKEDLLYVDGLFEKAINCYKGTDDSIMCFAETE